MPANLTHDYKAAEARYRSSREPADRLEALRDMLRLIPKHKGTDHLQADIKAKIKELTEELAGPRKGAARTGPPTVIRHEGAAQVALLGPPNSGKSALHAALTHSHSTSEPYPFATQYPQPGMLPVDDVHIQMIDLPSISRVHPIPWIGNALQPADAACLVVDVSEPGCVEQVMEVHEILEERKVHLTPIWPTDSGAGQVDPDDPFTLYLPAVLVATKSDLVPSIREELQVLQDLCRHVYPSVVVSVETGEGLDDLGRWLFDALGVVRVYTKVPGQPPDMDRPFTVRQGESVIHVAELIHKDVAAGFTHARLWGRQGGEGRQVGRDHVVEDGDVIELHHA